MEILKAIQKHEQLCSILSCENMQEITNAEGLSFVFNMQ